MRIAFIAPYSASYTEESVAVRVQDFIQLLLPASERIDLVTNRELPPDLSGERVSLIKLGYWDSDWFAAKVFNHIFSQVMTSLYLMRNIDSLDTVFLRTASSSLVLPVITARLMGKKVILYIEGVESQTIQLSYGGYLDTSWRLPLGYWKK